MTAVPVSPADKLREAADHGLVELPTDLAIPLSELLRALADRYDNLGLGDFSPELQARGERAIGGFVQATALAEVILARSGAQSRDQIPSCGTHDCDTCGSPKGRCCQHCPYVVGGHSASATHGGEDRG